MAIAALEKGTSEPRSLVLLTLASGVYRFISGAHDTIDDANMIVETIGDIGQSLDLETRQVSYGTTEITFVDDGELRALVAAETVKNQTVQILQGTSSLPEGSFEEIFNGIIDEIKPFEGGVRLTADDTRGELKDKDLKAKDFIPGTSSGIIINRHPLQIMLAILKEVFEVARIDEASFDPDNYDTGARAISHWTTARASHGQFDRRILEPESALQMLADLSMLMEGSIITDLDGTLRFVLFDPSAAVAATLTPNDIGEVEQLETYFETINRMDLLFAWRGSGPTDGGTIAAGGILGADAPRRGEYLNQWGKIDLTSVAKHKRPGNTSPSSGVMAREFKTPWVGVDTILEEAVDDVALSLTCIGGWASSFCGVDRILDGASDGSVNNTVNTGDRKGFIKVQFPVGELEDGSAILAYEVIQYSDITIDFQSQSSPAQEGDDDLAGVGTRVTFTIPAGGRGKFGTIALDLPKETLVSDFTIPIQFTERRLERFINGLPVFKFEAGLEHLDLLVTDMVSLPDQDIFLAEGENGLTGSEKLEIIEKSITPLGNDARLEFTVVPAVGPGLGATDDFYDNIQDHLDDVIKGPWDDADAPNWDIHIPAGVQLFDAGGGEIGIRRGRVSGPSGSIEVFSPGGIPTITPVSLADNYLTYDTHGRYFNRVDVAVSAADPLPIPGQATIGKVETDGGGAFVGSPEDLRLTGRMIATPEAFHGMNRGLLNGSLTMRFRNSDRYAPDGVEVTPMDSVWGPGGAAGNASELTQVASEVESGDAAIKLFTPGEGLKTPLYAIDDELDWLAEWKWKGSAVGGDAIGEVLFIAQDRRTVIATSSVFSKLSAIPGIAQFDREALKAPVGARFIRLQFRKGPSSGVGVFVVLDSMGLKRAKDSFHAKMTLGQTLLTGVFTKIFFNVFEAAGPWGAHNIGSRYTLRTIIVPTSPFYTCREAAEFEFEGGCEFTGHGTHYNVDMGLFINGVLRVFSRGGMGTGNVNGAGSGAWRLLLNQFDTVDLRVRHFTGASESLLPTDGVYFSGRQVL